MDSLKFYAEIEAAKIVLLINDGENGSSEALFAAKNPITGESLARALRDLADKVEHNPIVGGLDDV